MEAAKKHGTIISYDLNYRDSLGDRSEAKRVLRKSIVNWLHWSM